MQVRTISAVILGLTMMSVTAPSQAQEVANNSSFGDWLVNCEAVTITQTSCRLLQVLTNAEDESLVARFVAVPGAGDTTVLLAQVPIGVYLPGGAVFRPEGAEDSMQKEMIWQRCLGRICEAAIGLTPEDLETFTTAGAILFGYRMQLDADPIIIRADVSRFAEAMELIRPKTAE